jgi:peptidoglycan/LPS O-acetylase OafA/YrhL
VLIHDLAKQLDAKPSSGDAAPAVNMRRLLKDFWERRVRRLFPALALMITATFFFSNFVYLPDTFQTLGNQVRAVLLMQANFFYLWNSESYWAADESTVPFLHCWSLAVEEQFYVLYPVIIGLFYKLPAVRNNIRVALAIFLLAIFGSSLTLSVHQTKTNASVAFYLLPSRAWEMALGGLLCCTDLSQLPKPLREALGILGISMIVASFFIFDTTTAYPSYNALCPTGGAALFIASQQGEVTMSGKLMSQGVLVFVGKISYGLYLWHWPIYVLLIANDGTRNLTLGTAWGGVVTSFVFAAISFIYVEPIFRKVKGSAAVVTVTEVVEKVMEMEMEKGESTEEGGEGEEDSLVVQKSPPTPTNDRSGKGTKASKSSLTIMLLAWMCIYGFSEFSSRNQIGGVFFHDDAGLSDIADVINEHNAHNGTIVTPPDEGKGDGKDDGNDGGENDGATQPAEPEESSGGGDGDGDGGGGDDGDGKQEEVCTKKHWINDAERNDLYNIPRSALSMSKVQASQPNMRTASETYHDGKRIGSLAGTKTVVAIGSSHCLMHGVRLDELSKEYEDVLVYFWCRNGSPGKFDVSANVSVTDGVYDVHSKDSFDELRLNAMADIIKQRGKIDKIVWLDRWGGDEAASEDDRWYNLVNKEPKEHDFKHDFDILTQMADEVLVVGDTPVIAGEGRPKAQDLVLQLYKKAGNTFNFKVEEDKFRTDITRDVEGQIVRTIEEGGYGDKVKYYKTMDNFINPEDGSLYIFNPWNKRVAFIDRDHLTTDGSMMLDQVYRKIVFWEEFCEDEGRRMEGRANERWRR